MKFKYEEIFCSDIFAAALTEGGVFYVKFHSKGEWQRRDWYRNENGKPWIPAKVKTFKSLVKMAIRDGDYK